MTYAEFKGQPLPPDQIAKLKLVFKGDKHILFNGEMVEAIGGHSLDPAKKSIDITEDEGPNKGKSNRGIYLLKDDLFIVCYNTPGMERPTAFTSKADSTIYLFIYKRAEATESAEKPAVKLNDATVEKTLTVTIHLQKSRLRAKEHFKVDLRVVNSSKSSQSIQVMNCSWDDHWKSSNKLVSWEGWDCTKNFAVTVKLEPGEAYEKTLSMLLLDGEPQEKVSFKMGFTPIGSKQTYWSNEVALQVGRPDDSSRPSGR